MKTIFLSACLLLTAALYTPLHAQPVDTLAQVYSKFDFVPGEKVIFYDDFSNDAIGDFPVQWNTNGSGEVVTFPKYPGKWFHITNHRGAVHLADPLTLPENYTIEFDVVAQKNPQNSNGTGWNFYLISTPKPKDIMYGVARPGGTGVKFEFDYNAYITAYYADNSPVISGNIHTGKPEADRKYHVSIWVQKERIRLYMDETKLFDLAKGISLKYKYNMIRFQGGINLVGNVRIATGLPDMRNKLLTTGKLVSYGIYFDVNADKVKPPSAGTLKMISDILIENPALRIKIVGYTDSDGDDASNLDLSKRRAAAVKQALINSYGIDAARLETDGKGEKDPVAPNTSGVNKALNRRVEFLKL